MPEMRFRIRWPDGRLETCYSPSLVVRDYLVEGESYTLADFLDCSRVALSIASERVRAKYGRPCPRARGQLARLEMMAGAYERDARVMLETFEP
jgi:uncharacterized repeat protein (TIGR04042 family)